MIISANNIKNIASSAQQNNLQKVSSNNVTFGCCNKDCRCDEFTPSKFVAPSEFSFSELMTAKKEIGNIRKFFKNNMNNLNSYSNSFALNSDGKMVPMECFDGVSNKVIRGKNTYFTDGDGSRYSLMQKDDKELIEIVRTQKDGSIKTLEKLFDGSIIETIQKGDVITSRKEYHGMFANLSAKK